MREEFDRYSVHPDDPFLAAGGFPAAVRHDPYEGIDPTLPENKGWVGHADCAADWDPCQCHGDRLCNLGKWMRWYLSGLSHLAYLRGEAEVATATAHAERLGGGLTQATTAKRSDAMLKVWLAERTAAAWPRDIWPLIVANARQARAQGRLLG